MRRFPRCRRKQRLWAARNGAPCCYDLAARWADRLDLPGAELRSRAFQLQTFIQDHLFCAETSLFMDLWNVGRGNAPRTFDGMWPVVTGAARPDQAARVSLRYGRADAAGSTSAVCAWQNARRIGFSERIAL